MKISHKRVHKTALNSESALRKSSSLAELRNNFLKHDRSHSEAHSSAQFNKHAFNVQRMLISIGLEPGHVRHYLKLLSQYKLTDFTPTKLAALIRLFRFCPVGGNIILPVASPPKAPKQTAVVHGLESNISEIMDYTTAQKAELDKILHIS